MDDRHRLKRVKRNATCPVLRIDGSYREGGGQLLRNAISYAAILHKPVTIYNIRKGRAKDGLSAQHLTGLNLVRDISRGTLQGASLRSTQVTFLPSSTSNNASPNAKTSSTSDDSKSPKLIIGDTGTAGSICLLLQAALPVCLFQSECFKLDLRGGTDADMAPPYDYFSNVFLPMASKSFNFERHIRSVEVNRRGFFPKGGGRVTLTIDHLNKPLQPISLLDPGQISQIKIISYHAGALFTNETAKCMTDTAHKFLIESNLISKHVKFQKTVEDYTSISKGNACGIFILCHTTSLCRIAASENENRKESPDVSRPVSELLSALRSHTCVDQHLQDQLILYMSLANGQSQILVQSLTMHTMTAIYIARIMVLGVKFHIQKINQDDISLQINNVTIIQEDNFDLFEKENLTSEDEGSFIITCYGVGLRMPFFSS